jgi:hypothetical protein
MKTFVLALTAALGTAPAFAHSSLLPHEHPHAISMLPDAVALMLAAFLVGIGAVALRRIRKE